MGSGARPGLPSPDCLAKPETLSSIAVTDLAYEGAVASMSNNPGGPGGASNAPSRNWIVAAEFMDNLSNNIDKESDAIDRALTAGKVVRYLSAQNAFRLHSLLQAEPALNAVGNLRGMVINRNWRHVYELSVKYVDGVEKLGEKFRPAADFVAWANYLCGWGGEIDRELRSRETWDIKGQRLCLYATTAATRMLTGTAHGITDLIVDGVEKSCKLAAAAGVTKAPGSTECASYGDIARASVAVYYQTIDDATTPDALRKTLIDVETPAIDAVMGWASGSTRVARFPLK
jgi:DNA-binding protein Fis